MSVLSRLADFGDQLEEDPNSGFAPFGFSTGVVRWVIYLTEIGELAQPGLGDLADEGNSKGQPMQIPDMVRTSNVSPVLAVDDLRYICWPADGDEQVLVRQEAFLELHTEASKSAPILEAVCGFLTGEQRPVIDTDQHSPTDLAAFRVGDRWVHDDPHVRSVWQNVIGQRKATAAGQCLVTGDWVPLARTFPTKISSTLVPDGTKPLSLVSANKAAYTRTGTEKLEATPIGIGTAERSMSALTWLLDNDRHSWPIKKHRKHSTGTVTTWWIPEQNPGGFDPFAILDEADPADVAALFDSVDGSRPAASIDPARFCALTLAASGSRLVVHDWIDEPLARTQQRLAAWFADHQIIDAYSGELTQVPLWRLVLSAGRYRDGRYVDPAHGTDRALLGAALHGRSPGSAVLNRTLARMRADNHHGTERMALLRLLTLRLDPKGPRMSPALDDTTTDPHYLTGRLFAACESAQRRAIPAINTTIADRLLARASTNPAVVMGRVLANGQNHTAKITRSTPGLGHWYANQIDTLAARITEFPVRANAFEQARFMLGYHHQRARRPESTDTTQPSETDLTDQETTADA